MIGSYAGGELMCVPFDTERCLASRREPEPDLVDGQF